MVRTKASGCVVVDKEKVVPPLGVLSAIDWLDKALTTMVEAAKLSTAGWLRQHQTIALVRFFMVVK